MPAPTANTTEKKMGHYTNGDTNGDDTFDQLIPRSIPQEPVSMARKPYIPPKNSKLLHPGNHHTCPFPTLH
jgi:peroxygenase